MGLTLEPMPGRLNDRAAQSLVLSAQPASAINVQKRLHQMAWPFGPRRAAHTRGARSAASFIFKQADHVAYWQILFQTVSHAAGSGGNRLRSFGRGSGGPADGPRLKIGEKGRLKEGPGAVGHDQQAAGQHQDILQPEPPAPGQAGETV